LAHKEKQKKAKRTKKSSHPIRVLSPETRRRHKLTRAKKEFIVGTIIKPQYGHKRKRATTAGRR